MSNQPYHATPSPNVLPPNPFAAEEPSSQRANASIDLTSAQSPSPSSSRSSIYERDLLSKQTSPRYHHISGNDARRKLSDATRVPNPATGYQGPPAKKKPTAGKGFQPMDTLSGDVIAVGNNPAYGRKHPTTYAKLDRNTNLIGKQRHGGQQKYIEQHRHQSQPSPAKRRKTQHAVAEPVHTVEIEGSEEDEVQQESQVPRQASTPRAHSVVSSRSPHSIASRQSGTQPKTRSVPMSEFASTSNLLIPKRTNPRRKNGNAKDENQKTQKTFKVDVPSLGAGSLSQGHFLEMVGDNIESSKIGSLGEDEQGVTHRMKDRHQSQHPFEKVTSRHFPPDRMRISELTAEEYDRIASGRPVEPFLNKNLREYRPADNQPLEKRDDPPELSEDELAPLDTPKLRRKQVPFGSARQGKATPGKPAAACKSYALSYVRTHKSQLDGSEFILQPTDHRLNFRISNTDADGRERTLHHLDLGSVNRAVVDDTHHMRLTGGISRGNQYWYDLRFQHTDQFKRFRDEVVFPSLAQSNRFIKSEEHLKSLFERPLPTKETIDQSATKSEATHVAMSHVEQQLRSHEPLLTPMLSGLRDLSNSATSNHNDLREPDTRIRTRPLRRTRAAIASSNQPLSDDEKDVVKYSKTGKLGRPHLDFHIQDDFLKRRRCTVNFDDLPKLDEEEFLNDSLVNFYLLYLYTQLKVSVDRVYFFNTYFFDTLTNTKDTNKGDAINYEAVKSWTKRDDVFSYDHIVVPINEKFHWYLAIICNVATIARKPAIEEFQESSPDLDGTGARSSEIATAEDLEKNSIAEEQPWANDVVPAQNLSVGKDTKDDEENLFEEEKKLSLIDADEETTAGVQLRTETLATPHRKTDAEIMAAGALQPSYARGNSLGPAPNKERQSQKKKKKPSGPKRDPNKPVIMVLDSLGSIHSNATRALRQWLEAEGLEKRGMTVEIDHKGFYPKSAQIPMQSNFSDCGLYVLGYAKKFFSDPDEFKTRLLKGEMTSEADWPDMDASKMRSDIRELILRLYEEQKGAHKAKKAAKAKDAVPLPNVDENKETGTRKQRFDVTGTTISAAASDRSHLVTAPSEYVTSPLTKPRLKSYLNTAGAGTSQAGAVQDLQADVASAGPPTIESTQRATERAKPVPPRTSPRKSDESSEVRVALRSPHVGNSLYTRFDAITDLSSPLRKHKLHSTHDQRTRTLSAERAQAASPSRTTVKCPAPSSPLDSQARAGSNDDPISLDDSQDLDTPVQRKLRSPKAPSPEIVELDRSQEYISPSARHGLPVERSASHPQFERDDSIQEVFSHEWQEGRDVNHALKASRTDQARHEDERGHVNEVAPANERPGGHSSSSHTIEGKSEAQAMDMDSNDDEIPESPQQLMDSPGNAADEMDWQLSLV
ncbi:sentrin-specific protease [Stagonosporopsis vannaccii]|nr:sentrin-specific protease [Stagonosporopsis vannaccii]